MNNTENIIRDLKEKKIILFDLDGTLTDPKEGITKSVQYALSKFGIHEERDDLIKFIGPPLRESFGKFYGFGDSDAEKAVAGYREYFTAAGIFENVIYSGIPDILESLKNNGKILAVATNKTTDYACRILEHFRIDKYFSFVSGDKPDGSLSKNGKKSIIRIAMDALAANDCRYAVMVGDRKHDIIGAKENGMDSIGVLYGYGTLQELMDAGATYTAETTSKLSGLLCRR